MTVASGFCIEHAVPVSLHTQDLGYASALLLAIDFARRMRAHGFAADARALLADAAYARELVSLGHTSACAKLRASAMRVFALHHG